MQERHDCTRSVNKSWFPGPCSQYKSEGIAQDVSTNHGFQDHTRNATVKELQQRFPNHCFHDRARNVRVKELQEKCSQVIDSTTVLALQEWENCTSGVHTSWFPGPRSQCKGEILSQDLLTNLGSQDHRTDIIAREVLTNHGFQDHDYSQCRSEWIARKVFTNHCFQDRTRNARGRKLHEMCS